jgi:ABC-type lipoprotein export system ATPase subunit
MSQHQAGQSSAVAAPTPHHLLRSLSVSDGFLKGARFDFVDGLNVIIGVRGSGKSTTLSYIRYLLEGANGARGAALRSLVKENLGAGRVKLALTTKYGVAYTGERRCDEALHVFDEKGAASSVSLDRDGVFGADIYSHNDLERIAETPRLQLELLDRFVDEDVRRIDVEARRVEHELQRTASELQRLTEEERDLQDRTSEVAALSAKLAALEPATGPDGDVLARAHAARTLREREKRAAHEIDADLAMAREEAAKLAASFKRRVLARVDDELLRGANADVMARVKAHALTAQQAVDEALMTAAGHCETARDRVAKEQRALVAIHRTQDDEYRALLERSNEHAGVTAERERLQKRLVELADARAALTSRQQERAACAEKRRTLFSELSLLRDERYALRKKVADDLTAKLSPNVRVDIVQSEDRSRYRELLGEALKGASMKAGPVADRLCAALAPDELFALVQAGDDARLAERVGLDEERAKKVTAHLRNTEAMYAIEGVALEDEPCVELRDGDFKRADTLSPGQRCTAILPILLLESDRPLIIDQPEDNLDNRFISTIAAVLKNAQRTRQLLFVTHNANIPVLGDAQRVFVLESDGRHSRIACFGAVDDPEVKEAIVTILEGGREAFDERKNVYGN